MTKETKILVKDLHKKFGNHQVLAGVNLDIKKGRSTVIIGGSGTGKSVLIKAIMGLIMPDSGSVIIDGEDVTNKGINERFDMMSEYGFLFQGGALFDSLNVEDNITFFAEKLFNLSKSDKRALAIEKLEEVGLTPRVLLLAPSELSGGMQKRVALARAICSRPSVIFFDEPTTGLDPIMANVINQLMIQIREKTGVTTVTITHDMNSAHLIGEDIAMLHDGVIKWTGTRDDLKKSSNQYVNQFVHGSIKGPIEV